MNHQNSSINQEPDFVLPSDWAVFGPVGKECPEPDFSTVRVSSDDGVSWTDAAVLHEGPAAYSSLAALADGRIACLYESGCDHLHETIAYAALSLDFFKLTDSPEHEYHDE